jgi:hypothetical protein
VQTLLGIHRTQTHERLTNQLLLFGRHSLSVQYAGISVGH